MVSKVQELKEQGNNSLNDGRFAEAIFHYTHAIKLDPLQYQLYSNRSLAFLKMEQYYYAREDALETIRLKPDWAKAYFRLAEVQFQTEHYDEALDSYRKALQMIGSDKPGSTNILEAIQKTKKEQLAVQRADHQMPWLGSGFGFVVGVLLVVSDYVLRDVHILGHPMLKLAVVLSCAILGFALAKLNRYFIHKHKKSLLDPPVDLLGEEDSSVANTPEKEEEKVKTSSPKNNLRQRSKKKSRS